MAASVLCLDQGTTGTTALLLDEKLKVLAKVNREFPQHFPKAAWVEHDLEEIWKTVETTTKECIAKAGISPTSIAAIGITNQRETTCLWHREPDAKPLCRAIVWQDRRTADACAKLRSQGKERWIRSKTGLVLDPYFSATKLGWMLANIPQAKSLAHSGKIAFGTIDSYLLYRLSGAHATDPSNACRTLLMNLKTLDWDEELLKLFKIPKSLLPKILPSAVEYGKTRRLSFLPEGIPITGLAGDQQAALFGQAAFEKGSAKSTYGTGAFVLANIGNRPLISKHGLLTSVAWQFDKSPTYCLEGSAFIAGAAVQWLRDGLQILHASSEIEALASDVQDSDGVVFVPALAGLGAPHWVSGARGLLSGLTRRTSRAHIARAALEGIAFQVKDLVEAMQKDLGKKISVLKVDGGASENNLLMQIQADLLNIPVVRSRVIETTALGAGLLAGLGVGLWSDLEQIRKLWDSDRTFGPKMSAASRRSEMKRWGTAVRASIQIAKSGE